MNTTAIIGGAAVCLSLLALFYPSAYRSLVLIPGLSLMLGDKNVWSFITCSFVSHSLTLLALHAGIVYFLGLKCEHPGGPHSSSRVFTTYSLSLALSGLTVYLVRLTLFLGSADENFLYKPVAGCGPLAVVAGVLAVEVYGDAAVHTAAALPVSQVPLLLVTLAFFLQHSGLASDATTSLCAGAVAWTYLRFFAPHGGPGSPLGDPREEFEALVFVPGPLRVALRPLEKLLSSLFLPIIHRLVGLVGGGVPLLPVGGGGLPYALGTVEGANPLPPLFGLPGGGLGGGGGGSLLGSIAVGPAPGGLGGAGGQSGGGG